MKKKVFGTPIKKGQVLNPTGRPSDAPEIKRIKILTKTEFDIVASQFLGMTKERLEELKDDPTLSVLDHMVLSVVRKAILYGDQNRFEFLLNRLIGRVPEKVFSKSEITMNVESMSPEELVEKSKEALDVVEAHYKNLSERYPDGDVPNISENMLGKAQLLIGKDDE